MAIEQPSLFATDAFGGTRPAPLAAAADPQTSHEAGERHKRSGKLNDHAVIVLSLLKRFPASSWRELFEAATYEERAELGEPQEVLRRFNTLMRIGKAEPGSERLCRVSKTKVREWSAVEQKS